MWYNNDKMNMSAINYNTQKQKLCVAVSTFSVLVAGLLFLFGILEGQEKYAMRYSSYAQSQHLSQRRLLVSSPENKITPGVEDFFLYEKYEHLHKEPIGPLKDVYDLPVAPSDRGLFWLIPRSGSNFLQHVIESCAFASDQAPESDHEQNHVKFEHANHRMGPQVLNRLGSQVSLAEEGLTRARESVNYDGPNHVRVFTSFYLNEAATLFDNPELRGGRVFALFRHPVEREVSLYHHLIESHWEQTHHPEIAQMTLKEYAFSSMAHSNWLVRYLANNKTGDLTRDDLELAKKILLEKVLVLLTNRMKESIGRLSTYFNWEFFPEKESCTLDTVSEEEDIFNKKDHAMLQEDTEEWEILASLNLLDIELYEYITYLFDSQGDIIYSRKVNSTLSK